MPEAPSLTLDRLYASPGLSGPSPRAVKYSPDGSRVTFLKAREDDGSRFDLWQFDVATGAQSMLVDSTLLEPEEVELSEEETALRERQRIAGQRGIVSYDWGTADTILVPIGGDLHLVTLVDDGSEIRQLTETDAFEYDAKVSPSGRYVSFIRDEAVWAIDLETGEEQRLTPEAEPENAISYGVAEFVAQEEMSRYTGYWWSPDDRYLAYTRVDESTVDIIPRYDIAAGETTVVEQRYPRAGRPNAIVDLFVRDMETGEVTEVSWRRDDWGPATDQYLTKVAWSQIANLHIQVSNRFQSEIRELTALGLRNWSALERPLKTQSSQTWVNLQPFGERGNRSHVWVTEETGFAALRGLFDEQPFVDRVGSENWSIDELLVWEALVPVEGSGVSGRTFIGIAHFTGFKDTPLERHLYRTDFRTGDISRITPLGSSWSITMAPDGKSFVGTSSSPDQPPQTGLYRADGTLIAWIEENALDETHPYFPYLSDHTVPEYGTLEAEDGQTLYYSIQTPPDFDPAKRYPVLVNVYGGPGVQTVDRDWERLTDVFYTQQGYIVFRLDNRGTANRGKAFEDVIYRQMGIPEVRDQLLGVGWLKSQPFVDSGRIAIQGWSYGGYMTLMTMLQAEPGTFAAAVSGAPVTDWALYDTFYTERYMDTPEDNPEGYERGSVFYHLDRWEGEMSPLLLIHGMADDNVTFDNTTRLMAALQERELPFELMTYPGQRHGIRGEALQKHLMKTRMAFLDRNLKDD
ncbi:MAG: S9 family peptidase [Pseudomonadota bacterium]